MRSWLSDQSQAAGQPGAPTRTLVLSGPPGCGKSTVLRVLAAGLDFDVCEWSPGPPMLWQEFTKLGVHAGEGSVIAVREYDV